MHGHGSMVLPKTKQLCTLLLKFVELHNQLILSTTVQRALRSAVDKQLCIDLRSNLSSLVARATEKVGLIRVSDKIKLHKLSKPLLPALLWVYGILLLF